MVTIANTFTGEERIHAVSFSAASFRVPPDDTMMFAGSGQEHPDRVSISRSLVDTSIKPHTKTVTEGVCTTGKLFRASYTQIVLYHCLLFCTSGWDSTQ